MITAIIQARMKSTRLPGKVAMPLAGVPILARVIGQAKVCQMIDQVVVVSSKDTEDDAVEAIAEECWVKCVRTNRAQDDGTNDVLAWFRNAAGTYPFSGSETFVRITGDCPLWCPLLGAHVIASHLAGGHYYTSNVHQRVDGFDTEVFSYGALVTADLEATSYYDRHHVTPWMRQRLNPAWIDHRPIVGGAKLSVDTQEDFYRCEDIVKCILKSPRGAGITCHRIMEEFSKKGYALCSDMPSPSPTSSEPAK